MKFSEGTNMGLVDEPSLSLEDLIAMSGLSKADVNHLLESGALTPNHEADTALHFSSHYLISIRVLSRLQQDFELESNALALTLLFLEKIRALEAQLHTLGARSDVHSASRSTMPLNLLEK